ncbi:MAG: hypothetical protein ACFFG0_06750, partial [Candidatus Thorarchaeota archaeon]
MSNESLTGFNQYNTHYFEGLEIGAVSVKWVRRTENGQVVSEVVRHEGSPKEKIKEIFKRHNVGKDSKIVITGQATSSFLDLPYISEIECLERAL